MHQIEEELTMRDRLTTIGPSFALAAALVLVLAGPARAVDGVIEINQARALAGAVTMCGDPATPEAPGFPVTICQPGSYRLTGNLTVPDANTTAIEITASDVTIDLNGFAIRGPTVCTGSPTTCTGGGTGRGIFASSGSNTTVLNGTVRGMGNRGLYLRAQSRVQGVHALSNGSDGILADSGSTVSGSTASSNGQGGILVAGSDSTVSGNTANRNGGFGLSAAGTVSGNTANRNGIFGLTVAGTVSGNTANSNGGIGIAADSGSTVSGNTARGNGGFGLAMGQAGASGSGYAGNVLSDNNGGGAQVQGGIQMGPNVCDTALCP